MRRIKCIFFLYFCLACISLHARTQLPAKITPIPIGGRSLCLAYEKLMQEQNIILKEPPTAEEIIGYAQQACLLSAKQHSIQEEISLSLVSYGMETLAHSLMKHFKKIPQKRINIILFGGVAEGGGEFYRNLLQQKINAALNTSRLQQKITVEFSTLGDKRAIIGAVAAAKMSPQFCEATNKYAIGMDIGGTNIRIGLVDLATMEIKGDICKEPVFTHQTDKRIMVRLGSILVKKSKLNNDQERAEQAQLTAITMDKLDSLIKQFASDKVSFVAIAAPGLIVNNQFIQVSFNLPFTGVNLAVELEKRTRLPMFVINDLAAAGVGEFVCAPKACNEKFLVVGVGTGFAATTVDPKHYKNLPSILKTQK